MIILNYSNIIDPLLKNVRRFIVRFSEVKDRDRILDICCGTGDQGFYFLKSKPKINFTGVDINPGMIKIAQKRKDKFGFKNISFLNIDAVKLPFANDSFDFALISLGLHETEKKLRKLIISEMKRVVKKNGFLIFVDFSSPLPKNIISLFIKAIEYSVDKERFKEYLKSGGLPKILKDNKLKPRKTSFLMSGLINVTKVRNTK